MTLFLAGCVALVLLSGLFYLRPRAVESSAEDLQQANLEAYRLRQQELAEEGASDLLDDARLRLLEDDESAIGETATAPDVGRFPAWVLLLALAVFSGGVYLQLGAIADVQITSELRGLGDQSSPEQMQSLIRSIESRAASRPQNLHYRALLGRYYMGQQDYPKAAEVYDALSMAAPEDAQALAYAAQAHYLAANRQLDDSARMRAERALAIDPHNRTALGLLGMASYEQAQYRAAVEYWQRLIAVEPPGSEAARMIEGIINQARAKLGEPVPELPEPEVAAVSGAGVSVRVVAPEGAGIAPGDSVFVLARNAESDSRMPIAVQRRSGAELPLELRLDDGSSMAGQKLSEAASVVVVVQVSPSGQPGEVNASWIGQAGPLAPSDAADMVEIVLAPRG
ncbi:c-type cytochrome biogenesis protein CcmI [Halioglobus japonicus]|uniref:C-type cytochrome biogenesis protein CcmI n=1 Tax=Halioglobus japonicus TaxID=930805 RepID=A0AAP8SNU2_9GAMM|nr:c-type cytochrome biogenesis protein CcmI [Halioglobus japonicus]AQA18817.1 c-type cytochrome biogenesis protein CcmI [Halioglobus japonicus]PLW86849.1 c-type cytochrome biogenesis protein CcmI [Halioglobus japonicus]GHD23736.1 c-type cytochrome biogenesis protein CcmI [Halioglobus japonicus]